MPSLSGYLTSEHDRTSQKVRISSSTTARTSHLASLNQPLSELAKSRIRGKGCATVNSNKGRFKKWHRTYRGRDSKLGPKHSGCLQPHCHCNRLVSSLFELKWRLGYSRQIGVLNFSRFELVTFGTTVPRFWNGVATLSAC